MSADYLPTPGPLPGVQWTPSNGTEGSAFHEAYCCNCRRDRVMNGEVTDFEATEDDYCPILGASFRGEAVEWREEEDGVSCIAFVEKGQDLPTRCPNTTDMFPEVPRG